MRRTSAGGSACASSRFVAFDTPGTRGMEEQEGVVGQVFESNADHVPRAHEPGMRVSDTPFGLEAPFP